MDKLGPLLLLDRDGVLNEMVVDADHGTVDSPLHPDQVRLTKHALSSLLRLQNRGCQFVIVTNQPAAAKGKTTKENLVRVHDRVVEALKAADIQVLGSYVCFHRAEDQCSCRKPKPGMLEEAIKAHGQSSREIWMVGDGITDLRAGIAAGVKTAFIAAKKSDIFNVLDEEKVFPDLWCRNLEEFAGAFMEGK